MGAGGSARGKGAGGKEGALAAASKEQGGKRRVPDIKARAGDREGSGPQEGSPEHRGLGTESARARTGPRTRVRGEMEALGGVGQLGGGLRRPGRRVEPRPCPPPAVGLCRGQAGGRVRGPRLAEGRWALAPRRGERPGLSYSAFSWKRPWRHKGWWLRPGPVAPPAVAARPGSAALRAGAAGR